MTGEFTEGYSRNNRMKIAEPSSDITPQNIKQMQNELLYLRQEVDFLKKVLKKRNRLLVLIDDTSYKFKIIYEMTQKENNLLTVSMLCEIAQVSRSIIIG